MVLGVEGCVVCVVIRVEVDARVEVDVAGIVLDVEGTVEVVSTVVEVVGLVVEVVRVRESGALTTSLIVTEL